MQHIIKTPTPCNRATNVTHDDAKNIMYERHATPPRPASIALQAKNHLTVLPDEMSGLSRLTQLQLQGNNLASVPPCLGHLQQLRLLNIGGNYKLKEGGLGQQLAAIASLRDVVLPYRLADAAEELRRAGKAVQLD